MKVLIALLTQIVAAAVAWHSFTKLAKDDKTRAEVLAHVGRLFALGFLIFVCNAALIHSEYTEKEFARREASTNAENARLEGIRNRDYLAAEIKRIAGRDFERYKPGLEQRFNLGFVIFSITGTEISSQVSTIDPKRFHADWLTAKLVSLDSYKVVFRTPDLYFDREIGLRNTLVELTRKDGSSHPIFADSSARVGIAVEVLQDHPMGVTMVVGMWETPPIPGSQ